MTERQLTYLDAIAEGLMVEMGTPSLAAIGPGHLRGTPTL